VLVHALREHGREQLIDRDVVVRERGRVKAGGPQAPNAFDSKVFGVLCQ